MTDMFVTRLGNYSRRLRTIKKHWTSFQENLLANKIAERIHRLRRLSLKDWLATPISYPAQAGSDRPAML